MNEPDTYDKVVAFLTRHPDRIPEAWRNPKFAPGGCLFAWCSVDRHGVGSYCGCLTMVKCGAAMVQVHAPRADDLTVAIRDDDRLPSRAQDIKPENLAVFAEWQRRLDKEWNRVPPWAHPRIEEEVFN